MWNIVADENMPLVEELFTDIAGKSGGIKRLAGRQISRNDLNDTDILLVRSITQVNQELLEDTPIRFVGTATIGVDHIDLNYLSQQDIEFSSAPGSNAQGVAEYVLTSIAYWAEQRQVDLSSVTIGIIGAGNVGSRVAKVLERLGIRYLLNDPPLEAAGDSRNFVSLEDIGQCDVVTCHVPLEKSGQYPTHHLVDSEFLRAMPDAGLLINTSRGPVLDNRAAFEVKQSGKRIDYILDVWEGEPDVYVPLMEQAMIATPHIAGYSQEGKIRGTYQLYQAFNQWQGAEDSIKLEELLPEAPKWQWSGSLDALYQSLKPYYDLKADDQRMREVQSDINNQFDGLRKNYPQRLEFLDNL
ncbi:4-phosphoerythronate dehydrogenase [Kangiella shandongensis]|uniref:4-phosphoerythronate dehydrogenase n=1 Tax=Kangiella shandongensis TaxID=2763258 RepID=UPI001CC09D52|nr:4-phosphoerythronate dehydrogenase [Kangiella shandongensis]